MLCTRKIYIYIYFLTNHVRPTHPITSDVQIDRFANGSSNPGSVFVCSLELPRRHLPSAKTVSSDLQGGNGYISHWSEEYHRPKGDGEPLPCIGPLTNRHLLEVAIAIYLCAALKNSPKKRGRPPPATWASHDDWMPWTFPVLDVRRSSHQQLRPGPWGWVKLDHYAILPKVRKPCFF